MYIYENDSHVLVSIMGNSYDLVMRLLFSVMVLLHFFKAGYLETHVACIYRRTLSISPVTPAENRFHM